MWLLIPLDLRLISRESILYTGCGCLIQRLGDLWSSFEQGRSFGHRNLGQVRFESVAKLAGRHLKEIHSTMIDARTVNFFQVPTTQLRNALEAHLAEVPMAERAALLEAAPEIAEALNQAPAASVQDTFAGDSE